MNSWIDLRALYLYISSIPRGYNPWLDVASDLIFFDSEITTHGILFCRHRVALRFRRLRVNIGYFGKYKLRLVVEVLGMGLPVVDAQSCAGTLRSFI